MRARSQQHERNGERAGQREQRDSQLGQGHPVPAGRGRPRRLAQIRTAQMHAAEHRGAPR